MICECGHGEEPHEYEDGLGQIHLLECTIDNCSCRGFREQVLK